MFGNKSVTLNIDLSKHRDLEDVLKSYRKTRITPWEHRELDDEFRRAIFKMLSDNIIESGKLNTMCGEVFAKFIESEDSKQILTEETIKAFRQLVSLVVGNIFNGNLGRNYRKEVKKACEVIILEYLNNKDRLNGILHEVYTKRFASRFSKFLEGTDNTNEVSNNR